jgi:hypothetical protein
MIAKPGDPTIRFVIADWIGDFHNENESNKTLRETLQDPLTNLHIKNSLLGCNVEVWSPEWCDYVCVAQLEHAEEIESGNWRWSSKLNDWIQLSFNWNDNMMHEKPLDWYCDTHEFSWCQTDLLTYNVKRNRITTTKSKTIRIHDNDVYDIMKEIAAHFEIERRY